MSNLRPKSWDHDNPIENISKIIWSSILNQPKIKGWNWKTIIKKRKEKKRSKSSQLTY